MTCLIHYRSLNHKKATTHKNVPPKILRSNSDVCVEPLTQVFNDCIEKSTFPDELKCADISSLPKNGSTNTGTKFRPISVLPTVSKLFERIMDKKDSCLYYTFFIFTSMWFSTRLQCTTCSGKALRKVQN